MEHRPGVQQLKHIRKMLNNSEHKILKLTNKLNCQYTRNLHQIEEQHFIVSKKPNPVYVTYADMFLKSPA